MFILLFAVTPNVTVVVAPENVLDGQTATVVAFIDAVPGISNVMVSQPSPGAQEPSSTVDGVSGNVTLEFSSVNRYNNGTYTANFTNAIGTDTAEFQLIVYC